MLKPINNYIIESGENTPAQDARRAAVNIGADNMKLNNEDLNELFNYSLEALMLERAITPQYFLLTGKESDYLTKAFNCYSEAAAVYTNPLEDAKLTPEQTQSVIDNTLFLFDKRRVSIKKLRKLITDKYKGSLYWSVRGIIKRIEDKNGLIIEAATKQIKIVTRAPDYNKVIDLDSKNKNDIDFLKAETMPERLHALGLSELYLFVSSYIFFG